MRQLAGSGSHLEYLRSGKSIEKDVTVNNLSKMVSQSAPHTPVSAPNHSEGAIFKSVPRLFSEPMVGSKSKSPVHTTKTSRLERNSPRLSERKQDSLEESFKVRSWGAAVPVHSPKNLSKKENKFFLKSPLIKRDTRVQLERSNSRDKKVERMQSLDGTHV